MLKSELDIYDSEELYISEKKMRHITHEVKIGKVKIGGSNPIVVQSMVLGNGSIDENIQEIVQLLNAGSELVRIALNSDETAKSLPYIVEKLVNKGFDDKVIVACGQYELERLLTKYEAECSVLAKIRVNPGNVGFGDKKDDKFEKVIKFAIKHNIPIRIGVNWGSVDKYLVNKLMDDNKYSKNPQPANIILRKALVLSALTSAKRAEEIGLTPDKIVISCKASKVPDLVAIYTTLAKMSNYALHLGVTEAGMGSKGIVNTASGLSVLLMNGIGDTIRASLTQAPGEDRTKEVVVCQEILQALGLRYFMPQVTSCPGCNRTKGDYFKTLVNDINDYIKLHLPLWKSRYIGIERLNIAVMGCIVNGPGESKYADIGISLPGNGEKDVAAVFSNGNKLCTLQGSNIRDQFIEIIKQYIKNNYEVV